MKSVRKLTPKLMFSGIGVILIAWLSACPTPAAAQGSPGQDAVYPPSGVCCKGSPAFIDASQFINVNNNNICSAIYSILQPPTYSAAVIDARGISGSTALTCAAGATPWNNGTTYQNKPSTILLPATGGPQPTPIIIPTPWILPSNTHLIGEGDANPVSATNPATTIQATSGFSGAMIQFGSSTVCPLVSSVPTCTGISVENLTLDGQGPLGQVVNGISNGFSQDGSSVNHVSLYQIRGLGLLIEGSSQGTAINSGPYSNLTFDLGTSQATSSTACAQILNAGSTHGIHGLTCISQTNDAPVAVLLDSSNNSVEDVRIVGFYDGISVGKNGVAQSNVLMNINGDTDNTCNPSCQTTVNVVHITSNNTVSDLSIMGVRNIGGSNTTTIQDDLTGLTTPLLDPSVAIYALGEKDTVSGGYSRYTTSPNAVGWAVGPKAPTNTTACARGSLYSCTGSTTNCMHGSYAALWACTLNGGNLQWVAVK
jgi:hypothetical protein